jgi:hypothetical protein
MFNATGKGREERNGLIEADKLRFKTSTAAEAFTAADHNTVERVGTMDPAAAEKVAQKQQGSSSGTKKEKSILTEKLDRLALTIGKAGGYAAVASMLVMIIQMLVEIYGYCQTERNEGFDTSSSLFVTAVG